MRRLLPRLRLKGGGAPVDAIVTPASFARSKHACRFDRLIARRRPLPAGFRRGLTAKPWTVKA